MKKLMFVAALALLLSSCAATKVKVKTPYSNGIPIDSIYLISTMIGPVVQPVLPLIDAAAFNDKTNSIADQIMTEEQQSIKHYQSILLKSLQKLPVTITPAAEINFEAASPYRVNEGIQIDNNNFPVVFFSEGDLNVLDFGNGKNIGRIFKHDENLKSRIARLTSELNLKPVLFSYNRLAVIKAGAFGISGKLRLESYLFLYNSSGDLVLDAYGRTKPVTINGKDIADYKMQLDNFYELAQLMSQELISYIK